MQLNFFVNTHDITIRWEGNCLAPLFGPIFIWWPCRGSNIQHLVEILSLSFGCFFVFTMLWIFCSNPWLGFCVLGYFAKFCCLLFIVCGSFKEKYVVVIFEKKKDRGGITKNEKGVLFLEDFLTIPLIWIHVFLVCDFVGFICF